MADLKCFAFNDEPELGLPTSPSSEGLYFQHRQGGRVSRRFGSWMKASLNYWGQACVFSAVTVPCCHVHPWVKSCLCVLLTSQGAEWIPRAPGPRHTDACTEPQTRAGPHGVGLCSCVSAVRPAEGGRPSMLPGPHGGQRVVGAAEASLSSQELPVPS